MLRWLVARLNAAEMLVDVEKTKAGTETQWLAENGIVDLFILLGPSPQQAKSHSQAWLSGTLLKSMTSVETPWLPDCWMLTSSAEDSRARVRITTSLTCRC